jgi:HPr kinase/phosphorylase
LLIHGTSVDISGLGVLILGASGAGKSDLALRLVSEGGWLVSDDQSEIALLNGSYFVTSPGPISGLIEVRGIGIRRVARKASCRLRLAVVLSPTEPERMPDAEYWNLPGVEGPEVPQITLFAPMASATARVREALRLAPFA